MHELTQTQAALVAGFSARRLRQLEEVNGPPRSEDGGYPPAELGRWIRQRAVSEIRVANDGQSYDYNAERARLTKAQADKTEIEVNEALGQVVRMPLVERHWQKLVTSMRAKLLALPTKAAARIAPPDRLVEATDQLQALVYEALAELAGDGIPDEIRERVAAQQRAAHESGGKAAAETVDQPMGRTAPDLKSGRQRRTWKVST